VGVAGDVLRVVQLNMDSLVSGGWRARRNEIVTWLDELDADVVCLQEVWQDDRHPSTAGWIAEHDAGDWYRKFGGFPPPDPAAVGADPSLRFGSAILSRWPCDDLDVMTLPVCRDERGPATSDDAPSGVAGRDAVRAAACSHRWA
jgi:endonuclease/exonuclease/phosphatase family metal-dependent hydrolase